MEKRCPKCGGELLETPKDFFWYEKRYMCASCRSEVSEKELKNK